MVFRGLIKSGRQVREVVTECEERRSDGYFNQVRRERRKHDACDYTDVPPEPDSGKSKPSLTSDEVHNRNQGKRMTYDRAERHRAAGEY
jgi:hypothetical protein